MTEGQSPHSSRFEYCGSHRGGTAHHVPIHQCFNAAQHNEPGTSQSDIFVAQRTVLLLDTARTEREAHLLRPDKGNCICDKDHLIGRVPSSAKADRIHVNAIGDNTHAAGPGHNCADLCVSDCRLIGSIGMA